MAIKEVHVELEKLKTSTKLEGLSVKLLEVGLLRLMAVELGGEVLDVLFLIECMEMRYDDKYLQKMYRCN